MKKLFLILLVSSLFAGEIYGQDGSYQGSYSNSGQNTYIYGKDGSYQGSINHNGRNHYVYDAGGNYRGYYTK